MIPYIVQNYDKVFVARRNGKTGIYYIKVMPDNTVYYLEQATNIYGGERLLINKQMLKVNVEDLPNIKDLKDAIHKKRVKQWLNANRLQLPLRSTTANSTNNIPQNAEKSNTKNPLMLLIKMILGSAPCLIFFGVLKTSHLPLEVLPA